MVSTCLLAFLGLAASTLPAGATPQTVLEWNVATAKKIQHTIDAQNRRAEILDEQYLEAKTAIAHAEAGIVQAEADLQAGQQRSDALRRRLDKRAAVLYMNGGMGDTSFADFASTQEFGSRTQYGAAAEAQDIKLRNDVENAASQLRELRQGLKDKQQTARGQQRKVNSALKKLKAATAKQQALLASVNADIAGLMREISLQQETAAALAARAKFAKLFPKLFPQLGLEGVNPDIGVDPGNFPAPSLGAAVAVDFARKQLGDPYVYAAAGPDTWDCSGLTMVAWAQAGVTMVHNALAQYLMLPKVPLDQIQPGDLVFFGNPIHHVGIYVGAGTMIEAPHTGAFVRYASIFRDDLVLQAARP